MVPDYDKFFAWIGASDENGEDEVKFLVTQDSVPAEMWSDGEPEHNKGDCVYLSLISARLHVGQCDAELFAVCEANLN